MKLKCILTSIIGMFVFLSCSTTTTSYPKILTSDAMLKSSPSNNPSLSLPKKGFHPHFGVSYGDKQEYSDSSYETFQSLMVNTGVLFQPSLEIDKIIGPYYNMNASGSFSEIIINPDATTVSLLRENNIDDLDEKSNYYFEIKFQPGFLFKYNQIMAAAYLQGIVKYEYGDYYNFRKKSDGIANTYNIAKSQFIYGFGYGTDFQIGVLNYCDIGISFEVESLFNKTQSVDYSSLQEYEVVKFKNNNYRYSALTYEPYIDYKNIRFSVKISTTEVTNFSITYKF